MTFYILLSPTPPKAAPPHSLPWKKHIDNRISMLMCSEGRIMEEEERKGEMLGSGVQPKEKLLNYFSVKSSRIKWPKFILC